jgi:hypothetical protein
MSRNPYLRLGLVLSLSGAMLAPVFYFVLDSVPLAALAISGIILGLVSAMLANARPEVPPEASRMMLQTGVEHMASLLEELGLRSKAIYMPHPANGGRARALIPLNEKGSLPKKGQPVPNRLIARYGPNPEDICLVVTTPGTVSLDSIAINPGGGLDEIEGTLNQILVGMMDLADSVSVHALGDGIVVDVAKPKLRYDNVWFSHCLGSPLASIAASVVSKALNQPVRIAREDDTKTGIRIAIEVRDESLQ